MKYFDICATTKPSSEVISIVNKYNEQFFNPSALYSVSGKMKRDIEDARERIKRVLYVKRNSQIIFLPSATIANNCVLRTQIRRKDRKYLISAGEHSSVYQTAKDLLNQGYNIVFIPLKKSGHIDEEALFNALDDSVAFVSIIHTSNETGAINDIKSICNKIHALYPNVLIHSDGVQSINKIPVNLDKLDVDFYTFSGHKINCMRGIAGLYIRYFNKQQPYITGGGQEYGVVSGTENTAGIVSMAIAIHNAPDGDAVNIRKSIIEKLNIVPDVLLFDGDNYCPNIIMACFDGVRGESIVHMMEEKGYLIGTGSACNSKDKTNRVLTEMKVQQSYAMGAIRISFDSSTSVQDATEMADCLVECINEYRSKVGWKK